MRRLLFLAPVLVFIGLAVYFAAPLLNGADPSVIPSPLIDQPVPTFDLPPLPGRGHGLSSSELKGQVQIVNFFGSWCIPCRAEAPALLGLAKSTQIPIRGIDQWSSSKDSTEGEDAEAYLKELGDPYTSIGMDRDLRVSVDWGVYGAPETFIVDAQGRIRYKHVGPLTEADIRATILPLLIKLGAK